MVRGRSFPVTQVPRGGARLGSVLPGLLPLREQTAPWEVHHCGSQAGIRAAHLKPEGHLPEACKDEDSECCAWLPPQPHEADLRLPPGPGLHLGLALGLLSSPGSCSHLLLPRGHTVPFSLHVVETGICLSPSPPHLPLLCLSDVGAGRGDAVQRRDPHMGFTTRTALSSLKCHPVLVTHRACFLRCKRARRVGGGRFGFGCRSFRGSNSNSTTSWVTLSKSLNLSVLIFSIDETLVTAPNLLSCCEHETRTPIPLAHSQHYRRASGSIARHGWMGRCKSLVWDLGRSGT